MTIATGAGYGTDFRSGVAFDSKRFFERQLGETMRRAKKACPLYLEVGGVLDDFLAAQLVPGFERDCKERLLAELGDYELIYCVSAGRLDGGYVKRFRSMSYEDWVHGEIHSLMQRHPRVSVEVTNDTGGARTRAFVARLRGEGVRVSAMSHCPGYPHNLARVREWWSATGVVGTGAAIVAVVGAGSCSGKFAACVAHLLFSAAVDDDDARMATHRIERSARKYGIRLE